MNTQDAMGHGTGRKKSNGLLRKGPQMDTEERLARLEREMGIGQREMPNWAMGKGGWPLMRNAAIAAWMVAIFWMVFEMKSDAANIKEGVSSMKQDLSRVERDVSRVERDVSSMERDVSTMQLHVSFIQRDVSHMEIYGVEIKR